MGVPQAASGHLMDWIMCSCGKKLCKARDGVSVVAAVLAQIAVFCRSCKREVFLGVRK